MKLYEFAIVVAAETEWQAKKILANVGCVGVGKPLDERECPGEIEDCAHIWEKRYVCRSCGCTGNESCGAHPETVELCTLDPTGECFCCHKLGKEENQKRWKK